MEIYKFFSDTIYGKSPCFLRSSDACYIPFDNQNIDYLVFKDQIYQDKAEIERPDGTIMTPEEAKIYVSTLP